MNIKNYGVKTTRIKYVSIRKDINGCFAVRLKSNITKKSSLMIQNERFSITSNMVYYHPDHLTAQIDTKKRVIFGKFLFDVSKPSVLSGRGPRIWICDIPFLERIKDSQASRRAAINAL